ncbi:hypothetical protein EIP86_006782 [Pleurotus ostreatoroseus]|nr:hypothetical protein EIP86_006782 [Pleurotus ostreatoroseus]
MRKAHSPETEFTKRPRKRRRVNPQSTSPPCRQLLLEEIDLEIALQERLAATVQSRVSWALLLQQAVASGLTILVQEPEEQAFLVTSGIEVAGISLPGLRRLFELAVGGGLGLIPAHIPTQVNTESQASPEAEEVATPVEEGPKTVIEPTEEPALHVMRTLGHHVDSPALAPFLGRAPKSRHIKTYEEEKKIDIFGFDGSVSKPSWRKPYAHRNNARSSLDQVVEVPQPLTSVPRVGGKTSDQPTSTAGPSHAPKSRFRVAARFSVSDISLWIPQARRLEAFPDHTHYWRLAIISPSYQSLPISSILKQITVTCLTDPPPSVLVDPIIVGRAPWIISSTTDRPFLARLTFTWAGSEGQNPPMEVDHWVELDPVHLSTPILGDEQFFDVELDRNTELLNVQAESNFDVWDFSTKHAATSESMRENDKADGSGLASEYAAKLKSLCPQAPLTMKDVKAKLPRQLSYTLVSTPAQYRSLLYGRRKALEWRRARTLLEAYNELCPPLQPENSQIPLTTVDVLHWLEDEGQFPRSSTTSRPTEVSHPDASPRTLAMEKITEDLPGPDAYCRYCGLHYHYHPSPDQQGPQASLNDDDVKREPTPTIIPSVAASSACTSFCGGTTEISPIDVTRLLVPSVASADADMKRNDYGPWHNTSRDLATAAEPALTTAIRDLFAKWKLSNFPSSHSTIVAQSSQLSSSATSPTSLHRSRDDAETDIAPYALLSLVARSVTKALIKGGLQEFRRDEAGIRALGFKHRARKNVQVKRLLSPSHVVRGLVRSTSSQVSSEPSLLTVFAPLGISLPAIPDADGTPSTELMPSGDP